MIFIDGVHLISSESLEELHEFAVEKLLFKREWFQIHSRYPHYDLTTTRAKQRALKAGAKLITGPMLVRIIKDVPYLLEFYSLAVEQYEKDLYSLLSQHNVTCSLSDITKGKKAGYLNIGGLDIKVEGLFLKTYHKPLGFWRAFFEWEKKKKILLEHTYHPQK